MEENITCSTCKKMIRNTRGAIRFKCPQCMKYELIRCEHCRTTAVRYKCPDCGFEGPN